ncbi:unnamed protein product [Rhizophagus irregularis]|nr:unnamed protein product [Rhizophagus irregularis]
MSFRYVEVQPTFRKKHSRKITQNKESKMTDKTEVPDTIITLNCLLSPSGVAQRSNLSEGSVTTLKISTNKTVDQLRIMIRERWPHLFEKVPPAEFLLWKINDTEGVTSIEKQIEKFVHGERLNETGMPPHELISTLFPEPPLMIELIFMYLFKTSCNSDIVAFLCIVGRLPATFLFHK